MSRPTLCYYAYFEKDESYKKNLQFFLDHGINDAMDYVFIVNGTSTVTFPKLDNIEVLYHENTGFDFGSYAYAMNSAKHRWRDYDYFVFLNTSVRGPYTIRYRDYKHWQDVFTTKLNAETKLVGTTINAWPVTIYKPHVQGQMFALDKECLRMLLNETEVFRDADRSYWEVVHESEIGMSQAVLNHGWKITCLASKYQGVDYKRIAADVNPTSNNGDPNFVGAYWGGTVDALDIMFIKTNRGLPLPEFESFDGRGMVLGNGGLVASICVVVALVLLAMYFAKHIPLYSFIMVCAVLIVACMCLPREVRGKNQQSERM